MELYPFTHFIFVYRSSMNIGKGGVTLPPIEVSPVAPRLQPIQTTCEPQLVGLRRSNSLAPFTTLAPKVL